MQDWSGRSLESRLILRCLVWFFSHNSWGMLTRGKVHFSKLTTFFFGDRSNKIDVWFRSYLPIWATPWSLVCLPGRPCLSCRMVLSFVSAAFFTVLYSLEHVIHAMQVRQGYHKDLSVPISMTVHDCLAFGSFWKPKDLQERLSNMKRPGSCLSSWAIAKRSCLSDLTAPGRVTSCTIAEVAVKARAAARLKARRWFLTCFWYVFGFALIYIWVKPPLCWEDHWSLLKSWCGAHSPSAICRQ